MKYDSGDLKRGIQNPRLIKKEFLWRTKPLVDTVHKRFLVNLYDSIHGGINVMEQDWDNLIILDACRFDAFKERNYIDGSLSKVHSKGSASREWFVRNFVGEEYHDTVYVTGNVQIEKADDGVFHRAVKTYADGEDHRQGWMPEKMYEAAINSFGQYPNKRLVVHMMQPHTPYLGEKAEELRNKLSEEKELEWRYVNLLQNQEASNPEKELSDLLEAYRDGYISKEEVWECYVENLDIALEYAEKIINEIPGKTVISADHSELIGDRSLMMPLRNTGHHNWVYSKELRSVPWLEVNSNTRRDITAEEPVTSAEVSEEVIEDNLRALGYVD